MPYTPYHADWEDYPSTDTPVTAEALEYVEAGITTAQSGLEAHIADSSDAHDASAISIVDSGGDFTATDVEGALAELQADNEAHLADSSDAHDASAISISDSGGYFTGTEVEAALQELGAAQGGAGELDYQEITSDASITATAESSANTIVTADAVVFDGSTTVMIEFFCPRFDPPSSITMTLVLYEGSSAVTQVAVAEGDRHPMLVAVRRTPTAGSKTYSYRAFNASAGTGTIQAGNGASGNLAPAYIRIFSV